MANSYTSLFLHIVFSTKNRSRYINPDIEERIWNYMGGIARNMKLTSLQIGGVDDHVHMLIMTNPTTTVSNIIKNIKSDSFKWIRDTFNGLQNFAWQGGYGAFSVSKSDLPQVVDYIMNQREHHKKYSFDQEYIRLLQKHNIAFNMQYIPKAVQLVTKPLNFGTLGISSRVKLCFQSKTARQNKQHIPSAKKKSIAKRFNFACASHKKRFFDNLNCARYTLG